MRVFLLLGLAPPPLLRPSLLLPLTLLAGAAALLSLLAQPHLPGHLVLYYLAPVLAWRRALAPLAGVRAGPGVGVSRDHLATLVSCLLTLTFTSAAFHQRSWLSLGLLSSSLHLFLPPCSRACLLLLLLLACFPWLPALDGRTTCLPLVLCSGIILSCFHLKKVGAAATLSCISHPHLLLPILPLLSSSLVLLSSLAPSLLLQSLSWLLLLSCFPLALLSPPAPAHRLPALSLALSSCYLLLCLSYEALLLPCLAAMLHLLLAREQEAVLRRKEEQELVRRTSRSPRTGANISCSDILCVVSFLFLNFYSFFATGNIASLNSFDPSSIR